MTADQFITAHFEAYACTGPQGSQTAAEGFVSWVWGCREMALTALRADDLMSLADDILYSLHAAAAEANIAPRERDLPGHMATSSWLKANREALIAAIVESMT